MGGVWLRFRAEFRSRWRGWFGLALLVGLAGGTVTALIAGAQRTSTAYGRFVEAQHSSDIVIFNYPDDDGVAVFDFDEIARLPQVADSARAAFEWTNLGIGTPMIASVDDRLGSGISDVKLLEGRQADPERADEVTVSFLVAEAHHLHVGSTIAAIGGEVRNVGPGTPEFDELAPDDQAWVLARRDAVAGALPHGTQTVVGIVAVPGGFPPQHLGVVCCVFGTPAFAQLGLTGENEVLEVRLRRGARDLPAFTRELEERAAGLSINAQVQEEDTERVGRSIGVQALVLRWLALLVAVVGALILVQLLARVAFLDSVDHRTLDALGMTRGQRALVGLERAVFIGVSGGLVAVAVAIALSSLFPIGLARTAEPDPGIAVDQVAILVGAIGTTLTVVALAAPPTWLAARAPRGGASSGPRSTSRLAAASRRLGWPAPASTGVAMAFERGQGRTAVPVFTSLTAVTLGAAVVVGALCFGASLGHLLRSPRLYGAPWDLALTTYYAEDRPLPVDARAVIERHPAVRAFSIGKAVPGGDALIEGKRVGVAALDAVEGTVLPPIVAGRAPERGEVVLGGTTMHDLGVAIGDTVRVETSPRELQPFQVVGQGVLPSIDDQTGLGRGALFTFADFAMYEPGAAHSPDFLLRLAPGADADKTAAELRNALCPNPGVFGQYCGVWRVEFEQPADVVNFGRAEDTPRLTAGILGVLAVGTLAHVLLSSVRRRRGDLAVLKALGFTRRQVRATVAIQATTFAGIALLVAVPLGVIASRFLWDLRAEDLGIVSEPRAAWLDIVFLVLAALLLANIVAAWPARAAALTPTVRVLRSE